MGGKRLLAWLVTCPAPCAVAGSPCVLDPASSGHTSTSSNLSGATLVRATAAAASSPRPPHAGCNGRPCSNFGF